MKDTWFKWMVAMATLLLLAGCGSNRETDGVIAGDAQILNAQTLGIDNCLKCHNTNTAETNSWLNGAHGNANDFPYYSYFSDASCPTCHDALGDGQKLSLADVNLTNRPVISCESCHGGGQYHRGVGPLPYVRPEAAQCGSCHNQSFPESHRTYHPEAANIVEDYLASPHASSINDHNYVAGSTSDVNPRCSKCHTDEGAKLYKDIQGDSDVIKSLDANDPVADATPVQCRTCHNAHSPTELLLPELKDASDVVIESAEFRTCTNCHQKETAYHDPATNAYSVMGEIITDSHFDDPATQVIEGYNVKADSDRSCRDCHNEHAANNTINNQWASSGHAGHISEAKAAAGTDSVAVHAAGVTDADGPAFYHYDFKAAGREACQRCHTSTGGKNYLSNPAAYDMNANDFSHLAGEQREMLYCVTCHTNNAGGLVAPGAITAEYNEPGDGATPVTFTSTGKSDICIACHAGRLNGQYIKDNYAAVNFGTFNSHYLAAAGILYNKIGYHFLADSEYANGYFKHDTIGTEVVPGTGDGGPCVGCHMDGGNANHTLSPLSADGGGAAVCSACHLDLTAQGGGDYTLYPSVIEEEKAGFENALAAVRTLLELKGIYINSAKYPYVYTDQAFTTSLTNWGDEKNLGATFNEVMLEREPGAFAHNRKYAKRLLFDSIDWLDNGALDGTIDLSAPEYVEAVTWFTHYSGDPATAITRTGL